MAGTAEDTTEKDAVAPKKGMGKMGWIATGVLALGLGGGAFYVTFSGLLGGEAPVEQAEHARPDHAEDPPQFIELDPMMISVGSAGSIRQLRFRAFLQIADGHDDVASLQPRILDVFSTYLRAVSVERLEDPTALLNLRAQLLRRVQLLAGTGAVEDLLIVDFVIT